MAMASVVIMSATKLFPTLYLISKVFRHKFRSSVNVIVSGRQLADTFHSFNLPSGLILISLSIRIFELIVFFSSKKQYMGFRRCEKKKNKRFIRQDSMDKSRSFYDYLLTMNHIVLPSHRLFKAVTSPFFFC